MLENRINSLLISTNSGFKLKEKKIVSIYNSRAQVHFMFSFSTLFCYQIREMLEFGFFQCRQTVEILNI